MACPKQGGQGAVVDLLTTVDTTASIPVDMSVCKSGMWGGARIPWSVVLSGWSIDRKSKGLPPERPPMQAKSFTLKFRQNYWTQGARLTHKLFPFFRARRRRCRRGERKAGEVRRGQAIDGRAVIKREGVVHEKIKIVARRGGGNRTLDTLTV